MAFQHDADDTTITSCNLASHRFGDTHLPLRVLATIGMAAIHHHHLGQVCGAQLLAGLINTGGIVVRLAPAAQNNVAIFVARGGKNRRAAALGHRQEMVGARCRTNCVNRDLQAPIGRVLEPHRARQSGSQFAVHLALGCTGTNRPPSDNIRDILRTDQIQVFSGRRDPAPREIAQ